MKRNLFTIAAILCVGLLFSSCSKDDINDGGGGDSQAITSLINISNSNWAKSGSGYSFTFDEPEITQNITDLGAVWVYYSFDDGISYELAPSLGYSDDADNTFDFLATPGTDDQGGFVTLTATPYSGNSNAGPKFSNPAILVKIVSIPSAQLESHPNVNKADYNQVKRAFNLK